MHPDVASLTNSDTTGDLQNVVETIRIEMKTLKNQLAKFQNATNSAIRDLRESCIKISDEDENENKDEELKDLRQENAKIKDENKALTERINDLAYTLADLNNKAKIAENEKASLNHRSNEAVSPAINESYQSPTLEKPKGQSKENSMRTKPKHNQQNSGSNSTESPIAILGDSMIKMLNPSRLRRSIGRKTIVKTFPGASVTDMKHYVKPTLEKNPELIVLHVGTNDIHQKEPEEIVKEMESLCTGIVTNSLAKVAISEIIQREDESRNIKIKNTNNLLAKLCSKYKWAIVQHGNINISNLHASGLHLNITGTATLAKNYINFLKH
ncbi:Scavenger receptor cysteine-rich type 1 M130 [Paramuricea clavata]|uniref:Scavenger receptor cysteine-rich type 1 M130 n=1 Tax=Paramuricea clavata TaxID=317549 RepID=A0A7D9E3Z1_PARCT|nr:Scavenger receptor cysteine-rich type 1 M130 [Paramuricea clavata]